MAIANGGKHAVVLSSGGADGAYAIGAMKALFNGESPATGKQPLDPQVFVGSSIGAFNAAFIVAQGERDAASAVANLEQVWLADLAESQQHCGNGGYRLRVNPFTLLNPACFIAHPTQTLTDLASDSAFLTREWLARVRGFTASTDPLAQRSLRLLNLSSFISPAPLFRLIQKAIRFENIRRAKRALRIVATNWDTGELKDDFANGDMTDQDGPSIIAASAAVPGFFSPVRLGGNIYVDAAILGYTRLEAAIRAEAQTLHVIYVDPDIKLIDRAALENTAETLYLAFAIQWADNVNRSIDSIRTVNRYVELSEKFVEEGKISEENALALLQALLPARVKGRVAKDRRGVERITVHRYHPREYFGPLGLLDFDRSRVDRLIKLGFDETVKHDCDNSQCVLPAGGAPP